MGYTTAGDLWSYWGTFKSGIMIPYSIGPITPGAEVQIKYGRSGMLAVDSAMPMSFTAPTDAR